MSAMERYAEIKAELEQHYQTCPEGCKTTHIRCEIGWQLVAAEERAWRVAHLAIVESRAAARSAPGLEHMDGSGRHP